VFSSKRAGNYDIYSIGVDGTGLTRITSNSLDERDPEWSPRGNEISFERIWPQGYTDWHNIYIVAPNGSGERQLLPGSYYDRDATWSPDGNRIAFVSYALGQPQIHVINADGTGVMALTDDQADQQDTYYFVNGGPTWSPDDQKIAFIHQVCSVYCGGTQIQTINSDGSGGRTTLNSSNSVTAPDWQPHPYGYARPKSATPATFRLVPAFNECTSSNSTHGAPLASPSCNPPTQASSFLTLNAPDRPAPYNTAATSTSLVVMKIFCTDGAAPPCTVQNGDQQDVKIDATISDVRCIGTSGGCSAAGGTYSGKLLLTTTLRLTDQLSGPSIAEPATVADTPLQVGMQCSAGTCNISTSADSVIPGIAQEGKRAIWQLSDIKVLDGGSDGNLVTAPAPESGVCPPACAGNGSETVFLQQGLFAP
jgi:hypothetical protein